MDFAHSDSAWADIDRGIDKNDQIRRGDTFGQLRRELMAYNRASGLVLVRKRTGGGWPYPIIASQWIAVADDQRLSGQDQPPQPTSGVIASHASFPHGRPGKLSTRCCVTDQSRGPAGSMIIVEQR